LIYNLGVAPPKQRKPAPGSVVKITLASLSLLVFCLAPGSIPAARAQSVEHSGRRVIRSQKPDYPPILRSAGIGGVVRLNARVLANGTVANVQVLGGNPILADRAVKALMTWKYAPAAAPTNEIVTFNFDIPRN
jgi:TonB family protein